MKRKYIKPQLEVYSYLPEEGYSASVALSKDYVLIAGEDGSTMRSSEEYTEYTDEHGEYESGFWE